MTFANQLVLVSNRPIPNLTPALDRSFGPKKVFLLMDGTQNRQAAMLEGVYFRFGIEVERIMVPDHFRMESVKSAVQKLCSQFGPDDIALNVSCGSPSQRCGSFSVFLNENRPVFCVEDNTDRLIWIHPSERAEHPLEDRMRITPFLEAFGNKVLERRTDHHLPVEWKDLQDYLVKDAGVLQHAISVMNYYASRGEWEEHPQISGRDWLSRPFRDLLKKTVEEGLIVLNSKNITFTSDRARRFLNGDWLEIYVYQHLQNLRQHCGIHDLAWGLEFESENGNKNEMDVVFLADNKMHFIECKTSNMTSKKKKNYGLGVLYKLETVTDQAGIHAQAMLISYKDLKDSDKQRAKDLKVKTICSTKLKYLDKYLKEWIGI